MKSKFLFIIMLCLTSHAAIAISEQDKEKMMLLIKSASPYAVGMGKSVVDVCSEMANDMVKKYGTKLSEVGKSPSDIRKSASEICLDAASSASSAQSMDEVSMWKRSVMQNINQTFHGENSPARDFLVETAEHSEKMASQIAFMMELKQRQ
ncbi:hypothetical protein SNN83_003725 [Cronobacter malonaticus]|nr:hypothetical protein [Cronobacter malonaticus]